MTHITYDTQDTGRSDAARFGEAGLYYIVGMAVLGLALLFGMNFVVQGALQGLVAVLSGT